jgi:hypothetical protein
MTQKVFLSFLLDQKRNKKIKAVKSNLENYVSFREITQTRKRPPRRTELKHGFFIPCIQLIFYDSLFKARNISHFEDLKPFDK